ncbi:MAG: hypothetical protein K0Q50_2973, partial [Vampirovibrio sp.]|nr:hypothetical protein [Vampirovibrio sp.]
MHPFYGAGGISSERTLFAKKTLFARPCNNSLKTSSTASSPTVTTLTRTIQPEAFQSEAIHPVHPRNTSPLSATQAHAVRMLTFGARNTHVAPGLKLENEFIRQMKQSKNPTEKAMLA